MSKPCFRWNLLRWAMIDGLHPSRLEDDKFI